MAQIIVTGANGFIGQHLCRALIDQGHAVRGLSLGSSPLFFYNEKEIDSRFGDISDPSSIKEIAAGCDTVYHLAAIPRNDLSKSWNDFERTNIAGTVNLLREAQSSGVRRFVYISTVEAAGYGDGIKPRRESDVVHPDNNYGKSKLAAEKIVQSGSWNFERTVIRLPMIYGPGTRLIVPKLFGMVKRGFYPLIGHRSVLMEFCYVANAVYGIVLAGTHPAAAGELFYLSDERPYTIQEVIENVAVSMERTIRFIRIPVFVALFTANMFELIAKLLPFPPVVSPYSKKPFFTRETVRWTTQNVNFISTEKVRTVLGYKAEISIADGCAATARWLKAQGL